MTIELNAIIPELFVEDVKRSMDFYSRVLGLHPNNEISESDKPLYAELGNGSARLMLVAKDLLKAQALSLPQSILAGASVLMVPLGSPDIARAAYSNLENEIDILIPLREVGGGTVEFSFSDPDGNMIVILGR